MFTTIDLKNSDEKAILDFHVYQWLKANEPYRSYAFLENLRKHSSGSVVFQRLIKPTNGKPSKNITLYLHKVVAEQFLTDQKTAARNLVGSRNGDKLDCRLENLIYQSHSEMSRNRQTCNRTGYTGVYLENTRYRAMLTIDGKPFHIGMFDTSEEAALAYNRVAEKVYGDRAKLNKIDKNKG